jgi:hypothetical protein
MHRRRASALPDAKSPQFVDKDDDMTRPRTSRFRIPTASRHTGSDGATLTPALLMRTALVSAALSQAPFAAAGGNFPSGSNAITVKPGDTGTCALSPCRITLEMPPGDGSYEVTGNEISIGSYPAGKAVDIGNYFDSQALVIKGAGVKKTYVYILKGL